MGEGLQARPCSVGKQEKDLRFGKKIKSKLTTLKKSKTNRKLYGGLLVVATAGIVYFTVKLLPILSFLSTVGEPGYEKGPGDGFYLLFVLFYSVILLTLLAVFGLAMYKGIQSKSINN